MSRFSQKGFTLVEMIMVMAIFSIVSFIVGTSFNTLLKYSSRFMKSEESNIEGNVGLEMLRHDIASAGFGLFTGSVLGTAPAYNEATSALAATLNDSAIDNKYYRVPRAFAGTAGTNVAAVANTVNGVTYTTVSGSDYFTIKATSLGTQLAAQRWSYANFVSYSTAATPKSWPSDNLQNGDMVVVLDRSASSTDGGYKLMVDPSGNFWTSFNSAGLASRFNPQTPQDSTFIYGLVGSGGSAPRMPFNRADFFVAKPDGAGMFPAYCAPHTGILYRGLVRHADGALDYQPLLDCVASMHVVLGWNMLDGTGTPVTTSTQALSGSIDTWTNADGSVVSSTSSSVTTATMATAVADPAQVRTRLKVIKVYILAQIGKKDPSYTASSPVELFSRSEEGATPGTTYALSSDMLNYRWKVYKLVVRPKNLASNQ